MTETPQPTPEELQPQIECQIVPKDQLWQQVDELFPEPNMVMAILFVGDRFSCCDEGIVVKQGDETIGLSTIAPRGEQNTGQPTIVGLYIHPAQRRKGYGTALLEAAVTRGIERGFERIRIDALSSRVLSMVEKLPPELRARINIHDYEGIMDLMIEREEH